MTKAINLRQQKFIEYYLQSGNATEALLKAGYTSKHADRYAHNLMNKPYIKKEIEKSREKMNKAFQWTIEDKLKFLYEGVKYYSSTRDFDKGAKLIEVSNKMQGHNAPEKTISSVNINNDVDLVRDLTEKYLNELYNK